jgi:hypothetical protein
VTRIAAALVVIAALAVPASASADKHFQSPSHNIICAYFSKGGPGPFVRCDLLSANDVGYAVYRHGKGKKLKVFDSVFSPHAKTLKYGHSRRFGRFTCKSRRSGLTCKNRRNGHGFKVSRQKSKVF